ncbi:hypothetical protein [Nostoc sp. NMS7]|uniref:ORC-CDC6 family AAA ATPase n=1 Tax=Nostoc sp. NMS7 TaxID=2815391 RepID=UPI0025EDDFBB|nr:hypothetical protein [Nostoc sp. NMS7]
MVLKGLRYPEISALEQIEISFSIDTSSVGLTLPCSGKQLYDWACGVEQKVCDALDSFITPTDGLPGHDYLIALDIIKYPFILYAGQPITERVLLMLDDVHKLTWEQRRFLREELIDNRLPVGIWMAERLEALGVEELLSEGAILGRDHEGVINLEAFWRGNRRFEGVVKNIADCRVREAADTDIESFNGCLQNSLDGEKWQNKFAEGKLIVSERVRSSADQKQRYIQWVSEREQQKGTEKDNAIAWKTLEILIDREERKPYKQLTIFDLPLEVNELEKRDDSQVRAAAELFFCKEFKIPYYYGISRLANIASSNIEQFLWLTGSLFEVSLSAALLKQPCALPPNQQQQILKQAVEQRWNTLPQQVKYGHDVRKFLEAIGELSKWETNRPNAPYAPGVTGIAISMADRDKLQDPQQLAKDPGLAQLSRVIQICVAYNFLEVVVDAKQGQKGGQRWMLLYLNRMLCVHFDLPLTYGGWRPQSLTKLFRWLQRGFLPPKKEPELWL